MPGAAFLNCPCSTSEQQACRKEEAELMAGAPNSLQDSVVLARSILKLHQVQVSHLSVHCSKLQQAA